MNLNTVILKVAAPCNLNCSYCYEYNRGDESWRLKPKQILAKTAEQVGKLRSVRHYNGLPVDARSLTDDITSQEGL